MCWCGWSVERDRESEREKGEGRGERRGRGGVGRSREEGERREVCTRSVANASLVVECLWGQVP